MGPPGAWVVAACWSVQQLTAIPGRFVASGVLCAGLACIALGIAPALRAGARRALIVAGTALAACGWALWRADAALAARLPPALEGVTLTVVGVVDEMPQADAHGTRFRFAVEQCVAGAVECAGLGALRLGWYRGTGRDPGPPVPEILPGQRWQLAVRARRPHAPVNPGVFDAELRALEDGIAGIGSVRTRGDDAAANRRLDAFVATPGRAIERLRTAIRDRIAERSTAQDPAARAVVAALVIGDQAAIPSSWWGVFNRTGIGHLISISGLHITMLAALGASAASRLWSSAALARRMGARPLPSRLPTPVARWVAGLLVAFGYAGLAGWGIPAQRTCWMLAVAGAAVLSGRARSPVAVLGCAAAVVCVLDPWAPLAAGFWLSFAAVSAIIWAGSWRGHRRAAGADREPDRSGARRKHPWQARSREVLREALRSQVAATLVLLPLGVVFFASVSLASPFANAFAIPLVSGVITPIALAGAALALAWGPLGEPLLAAACLLAQALMGAVRWLDSGGLAAVTVPQPGAAALLLAAAACALLLAPMRWPGRVAAGLAFAPLMLTPVATPGPGEIALTAIDIGQGTAVLVEAGGRRLLYDTGPKTGPDSDAGARVVVPYLQARGVSRLDAIVVSHLDLDHSGGALSVLRALAVDWVASSLPADHPIAKSAARHFACRRGDAWQWGDTRFEFLHPGPEGETRVRSPTNARSCVLRIVSPAGVVLLTGDLEAAQERRLLDLYDAERLRADVLYAPHHGSATSSSPEFLAAVRPALTIFQVGYRNRYRHPNPGVFARYLGAGTTSLRSDAHGSISVALRAGRPPEVTRGRVDAPPYWRVQIDESAPLPAGRPREAATEARRRETRSKTPRSKAARPSEYPSDEHRPIETRSADPRSADSAPEDD
ncbi:MAG: DNA internalization-related competence protein ComEC/Rec2 [Burkholderiaceae bacterium]